jgi:hypothetical protein
MPTVGLTTLPSANQLYPTSERSHPIVQMARRGRWILNYAHMVEKARSKFYYILGLTAKSGHTVPTKATRVKYYIVATPLWPRCGRALDALIMSWECPDHSGAGLRS